MVEFMKLNFKFLIPTEEKKRELFLKLKPGELVNARVIDTSPGKMLVNIKGLEVMTDTDRNLQKGDTVKLRVQGFENDKVIVKIEEKSEEKLAEKNNTKTINIKANIEELKNRTKELAIKEGIFIKEDKIDKTVNKYIEIKAKENLEVKVPAVQQNENRNETKNITTEMSAKNGQNNILDVGKSFDLEIRNITEEKNIDKPLLKTLMILEKNNIGATDDGIKYLKAYINKETNKELIIDDKSGEEIKKLLDDTQKSNTDFDKGQTLTNAINVLEENKQIEFMFVPENQKKPAEIKIKSEDKGNKGAKVDKENFNLSIKLDLKNLGEMEIKTLVWKKSMEITFNMEDQKKSAEIMDGIEELKKRINGMGYTLDEVKSKVEEKKEEIKLRGVNLKA